MNVIKYGITLSLALFLMANTSQAADIVSRTFEFHPNNKTAVDNPAFWQITVKCQITTPDAENLLVGEMNRKSGKINGQPLKEGETTSLVVKNHDVMYITADALARVNITNKGHSTVVAKCST